MRIHIKDQHDRPRFTVHVDLKQPPTVVRLSENGGPAITLDWDRAVDDEHHLRHCPVCGCEGLFVRKFIPQLTAFVLIALAAVLATILFGLGQVAWALGVFLLILAVDVAAFFFSPRALVCYRCHSEFHGISIRRGHPRWHASTAERYQKR